MLTHLHSRWFICFPKLRFSDQRKTPQWQTGLCPNNKNASGILTDSLNFCILPYHTGTKWHERKSCHLEKLLSKRNSNYRNTPYASCKNPCQSTQQSSKYKPKDITYSSHDNTSPLKSSENLINMISTISQPALR